MQSIVAKPFGVRFTLALGCMAVVAVMFWSQSRYPALDDKAIMAGSIQLEDPLSFEAAFPIETEFPLWKKVVYSTLNWLSTNRNGMVFGLLLGSIFLTLFGYIRQRSFGGGFMNSVLGMVMGAPLGVCVNCAAPIAKGLYSGGARAETSLSAMIASPTLNIVVLTMLLSILPFYLVVAKIVLSVAVILLAVPLICRMLPSEQLQLAPEQLVSCPIPHPDEHGEYETIGKAVAGFAGDYLRDLWFILRTTVPLMLLAGFLGAIVANLVPAEQLGDVEFGLIGLALAALIGTFLPVPIAFDVVVCGALLSAGMPVGYVMVLLFTLGIFSVYSFFIVAQSISLRAASLITAVVIVIGIAAGYGADGYHKWQTKRALEILSGLSFGIVSSAHAETSAPVATATYKGQTVKIFKRDFQARSPAGDKAFTRLEARHIGIDKPIEFSFKDMWPPFWEGRSITTGDFDNDGDNDVILASTERGLYVFANDGSGKFEPVSFKLGEIYQLPIFNAALVDLNNDGWLDLFVATFRQGNFVLWNDNGRFDETRMTPVKNRDDAILSLALAFGDVDRDSDLDVALGNWAAGWYRRIPGEESRNRIVYNQNGEMTGDEFRELEGLPGETLSILLSDMNADGRLDLLVGNDFEQPDVYYYGQDDGSFARIRRADGVIPHTTTKTMSIKNADLNNDLVPELYIAQIAGRSSNVSATLKMQPIEKYCLIIEREADRSKCQTNMDIKNWYKSGNNFDPTFAHKCLELPEPYQSECKAMLVKDLAIQNEDPSICSFIKVSQQTARDYCEIHFREFRKPSAAELADNYKQILRRNVLLVRNKDGTYADETVPQGLEVGGWSWDVKIADFDNDEWQDVYIVNGTWVPNEVTPSNLYFANTGGTKFTEQSGPFGLEDYLITAAASSFDIDNDGDLDMIAVTVNGPVVAFINNAQRGHSIGFEFRDHAGNRFGIGSKVVIHYGEGGERSQVRELQAGGGFQSFDAPQMHFGLGEFDHVKSIDAHWSTDGVTRVDGPFAAGALYRIERRP